MKLSDIAAEPQLVEITLDDKETVKQYGEALVFYTWDRQPMDVFMRLANTDNKNTGDLINIVKTLILNEDGKPVIDDKNMLPTSVLMKAIAKVTEHLGK
jgi:hypothetical protein